MGQVARGEHPACVASERHLERRVFPFDITMVVVDGVFVPRQVVRSCEDCICMDLVIVRVRPAQCISG